MSREQPMLWTSEQVAAFLQLTPDRVKKMRQSGDGPPYTKIGREVRYIPRKVEHWIIEREQTSTNG